MDTGGPLQEIVDTYPVPRTQLEAYETRLRQLVEMDVLKPATRSEWIAGSFIIPKKDATARWITDLRHLNLNIRRHVYPMQRIQDLLTKRTGYQYITILDLSDWYYTFVIKESCRHLLTTTTPFGLFSAFRKVYV